jgi:hypothetical protein
MKISANNLIVALRRRVVSGNVISPVKIVAPAGIDLPGSVTVNTNGAVAGAFAYVSLASPITLTGGVSYYIVCSETNGGDQWYDDGTMVITTADATEDGSIYSFGGTAYTLNKGAGHTYEPVDFLYTVGPRAPLVGSPFPFLDHNIGGGQFLAPVVRSGTILAGSVVQGTIGLDALYAGIGGGGISGVNSVTYQWMIDGQPMLPTAYAQGPTQDPQHGIVLFPHTLDTTLYPDGTHVIYLRFVDSTTLDGNGSPQSLLTAYRYRSVGATLIFANNGFNNGAQTIPVTISPAKMARVRPVAPDFVTYPGTPTTCTAHPYPAPFVPPSSSVTLRDQINYYYQRPSRNMWDEYEAQQQFTTTPLGGVMVLGINSDHGGTVEEAYPGVVRDATQDGGRGENLISPYCTFVTAPSAAPYNGNGWFGIEQPPDVGQRRGW